MVQLVKIFSGYEGVVKCLFFDQWYFFLGSIDGLVMVWSMVGKYECCLMVFKYFKILVCYISIFVKRINVGWNGIELSVIVQGGNVFLIECVYMRFYIVGYLLVLRLFVVVVQFMIGGMVLIIVLIYVLVMLIFFSGVQQQVYRKMLKSFRVFVSGFIFKVRMVIFGIV